MLIVSFFSDRKLGKEWSFYRLCDITERRAHPSAGGLRSPAIYKPPPLGPSQRQGWIPIPPHYVYYYYASLAAESTHTSSARGLCNRPPGTSALQQTPSDWFDDKAHSKPWLFKTTQKGLIGVRSPRFNSPALCFSPFPWNLSVVTKQTGV